MEDMNKLIDAFIGYRDMLMPIQSDLHDFLNTYDALKVDIERLTNSFSDDAKSKLNEIYKSLAAQAQKSEELTRKVDEFLRSSNRYTEEVNKLIKTFDNISERISGINEIESKAEEQIERLDNLLEEKKQNYNLKELQKSLELYNNNLQQVGEFINKDVAESVVANTRLVQSIKDGNENILKYLEGQNKDIGELAETYKSSNDLLKQLVQANDVNEEYIFGVLDEWAKSRNIKTKK